MIVTFNILCLSDYSILMSIMIYTSMSNQRGIHVTFVLKIQKLKLAQEYTKQCFEGEQYDPGANRMRVKKEVGER